MGDLKQDLGGDAALRRCQKPLLRSKERNEFTKLSSDLLMRVHLCIPCTYHVHAIYTPYIYNYNNKLNKGLKMKVVNFMSNIFYPNF